MAKHLRECQRCAAELKEFDRPSQADNWLAGLKGLSGVLKGVVVATLVPLRPQAVARGVAAREHHFTADGLSISVGYRPVTDRRGVLSGVIISPFPRREGGLGGGRSPAGLQVTIFRQGEGVSVQRADELGHFVFDDVTSGEYEMAFDWDERMVLVTGISAR